MGGCQRQDVIRGRGRGRGGLAVAVGALLTVVSAAADAADLVNRGGTSNVPTLQGRVHYIKPTSASCPSGVNCFCNTGTDCKLPGTGTITGTVVIDRSGVNLDCQNRIIQAPRFANSLQQCTSSSECGQHSSGAPGHVCVNGYCQLGNLAGINIGGPLAVDDGSININVEATGYVQDVTVRNCVVKSFAHGYRVDGFEGDNGLDNLDIVSNTFRGNFSGVHIAATDGTVLNANSVRDNYTDGMFLDYNWSLQIVWNTINANAKRQILTDAMGGSRTNRWLEITGNLAQSTPGWTWFEPIYIIDLDGTANGQCDPSSSACDLLFASNEVWAETGAETVALRESFAATRPAVRFTDNVLVNSKLGVNDVRLDSFQLRPRCWEKNNRCFHAGIPTVCLPALLFVPGDCWY